MAGAARLFAKSAEIEGTISLVVDEFPDQMFSRKRNISYLHQNAFSDIVSRFKSSLIPRR